MHRMRAYVLKLSRIGLPWALEAPSRGSIWPSRGSPSPAVERDTADAVVMGEGRRVSIEDTRRYDGVTTSGVDETTNVAGPHGYPA